MELPCNPNLRICNRLGNPILTPNGHETLSGSPFAALCMVFGSGSPKHLKRIFKGSQVTRVRSQKDPKPNLRKDRPESQTTPGTIPKRSQIDPQKIPNPHVQKQDRSQQNPKPRVHGSPHDPKPHVHGSQNDPKPHTCKDPNRILPSSSFSAVESKDINICWKVLRSCPGCIFENHHSQPYVLLGRMGGTNVTHQEHSMHAFHLEQSIGRSHLSRIRVSEWRGTSNLGFSPPLPTHYPIFQFPSGQK